MTEPSKKELVAIEKRYEDIIDQITHLYQTIEMGNLLRYHKLGELFDDFCKEQTAGKYGSFTAERLAEDLKEREIIPEECDGRRLLYWAKAIFNAYPKVKSIEDLGSRGLKVSHLKVLLGVSQDIREELEGHLITDGKVVSVRELQHLAKSLSHDKIAAGAKDASAEAKAAMVEGTAAPSDVMEAEAVAPEVAAPEKADGKPAAKEEAKAEGKPAAKAEKGTRGLTKTKERTVASPLKTLSDMNKTLTKAMALVPDSFIVIKETAQIGFDNDAAFAKYKDMIEDVKASAQSLMEPLQTLIENIDGEVKAMAAVKAKP